MTTAKHKNKKTLQSLLSAFDRMDETAWFIRLMEENYHNADKFRWSLNSFLRSLKEIMQLVTIAVQGNSSIAEFVSKKKSELLKDELLKYLYKQRNIIVHKAMLKPASSGYIGFTRGRGLKLGMNLPIEPLEDSQIAILKYIRHVAKDGFDFMGILYTEDDGSGEYTCVQREWKLEQFPDIELTQLAANAWEKVAQVFFEVTAELGEEPIKPTFQLGNPNSVQFDIYNPAWVKAQLEHFKHQQ